MGGVASWIPGMVFGFLTRRRRDALRASAVPHEWRAIVERNIVVFRRLSPADQAELLGHVQVFLAEKHFEGCGGLALTDEIRVTIAAQACLLLLHRDTDYYPRLTSILVYPAGYTAHGTRTIGDGVWEEGPDERLGHTQQHLGALVLAWDSVTLGAADPADGDNLVLHEFAHQLDFEDNLTDGTPALDTRAGAGIRRCTRNWRGSTGRIRSPSWTTKARPILRAEREITPALTWISTAATNPASRPGMRPTH